MVALTSRAFTCLVSAAIAGVMNALNLFMLSSTGEGWPNVVGEAMACGVPCVVNDVGDVARIVGEAGFVVPSGTPEALAETALRFLASHEGSRQTMARSARKRVERLLTFGWSPRNTERCIRTQLTQTGYGTDVWPCRILQSHGFDPDAASRIVARMASTIAHRGPDGSDVWTDTQSGTALAHRRLAIIDLSAAGHQPMESVSGRYVLTYNGEIYNHKELRASLERQSGQRPWRGHSDTETLLACIEEYGLEATLKRLNGMFAFAVYDRVKKSVFLARDHVGEKPLYYGQQGKTLFFASELKAIRAHPDFVPTVDRNALSSFLRHNYIPTPLSIYSDIKKLPPGTFVRLDGQSSPVTTGLLKRRLGPKATWSCVVTRSFCPSLNICLEMLLSCRCRQTPLGAFLLGIDSSLIVA